eukprot:5832943-Lingulodinium_polyedra.AAC.1
MQPYVRKPPQKNDRNASLGHERGIDQHPGPDRWGRGWGGGECSFFILSFRREGEDLNALG